MQTGGLGETLLRRLSEAHPTSTVSLTRQFRMNGPIMALSNSLTYGMRLRAGGEAIESARLPLPLLPSVCPSSCKPSMLTSQ